MEPNQAGFRQSPIHPEYRAFGCPAVPRDWALITMVQSAFTLHPRGALFVPGAKPGQFTTYYFVRTFLSNMKGVLFFEPLLNTLLIIFPMSILALLIGGVLAWLVVRTDLPGRRMIARIAILPYTLPSWTLALAWITLFKNRRIGGAAGILEWLGFNLPDWVSFGPIPIICVMALHYYPFSFLLIGGALRDIDTRLEESALVLGADQKVILRRIVFSLVTPAVLSSWILTLARGLGSFGAPNILGRPVNFQVLSTRLYSNMQTGRPGEAYLLAIFMIILAVLFLYLNQKVIGTRKGFVTITGKASTKSMVRLGRYKYLISLGLSVSILRCGGSLIVLGLETVVKFRSTAFPTTTHFGSANDPLSCLGSQVFCAIPRWVESVGTLPALASCPAISGLLIGWWCGCGADGYRISWTSFRSCHTSCPALRSAPPICRRLVAAMFLPSLYGTFTLLIVVSMVKIFLALELESAA